MSKKTKKIEYPSRRFPDDPRDARLLGLYGQRQDGLYMQRVRLPGGRISPDILRGLAAISRDLTPGFPLHLTTRQDIELHGMTPDKVPASHRALADMGLSTVGACGDTLRNIVICPGAGLCPGSRDPYPLAIEMQKACESLSFIRELPRKFKISISGCAKGCARPYINDLAFIDDAKKGSFSAVVAGSLGARPETGIYFRGGLSARRAIALTIAAVRLFNDEGDRENRRRARLRHVRQRMGDRDFLKMLREYFRREYQSKSLPAAPRLAKAASLGKLRFQLHPPLGDMTPDQADDLAGAVAKGGATLRIGLEHELNIYGGRGLELPKELAAWENLPTVIACPGNTWCSSGIADSRGLAARLVEGYKGDGKIVCISGCPNNCSHPSVSDFGLIGRVKSIGGERRDCFRLCCGGGNGRSPALGREVHPAVPTESVPAVLNLIADFYRRSSARSGQRFGEFIDSRFDRIRDEIEKIVGE